MRRFFIRLFGVVLVGAVLPSSLPAQCGGHAGHGQASADPYRAASPYNITVVGRSAPNPANNMPNFTLCCEIPNINTDAYVWPEHERLGGFGCGGGCGSQCGALFSMPSFGCGRANWQRWGGSCGSSCGSSCGTSSCGTSSCGGCAAAPSCAAASAPAALPAVSQVVFWKKAESPVDQCLSCPPNGPKPKHTSQHPGSLGCASCSTWESETVFLFGTCRQFFGEPTHKWLHGK